jgi:O-antigen/teichoic acid export membrane protein
MLQRALDFPRLRILDGISKALSILTMLSLGVSGFGAVAIVAGANVIPAIPSAFDLLFVHRFRPRSGWFKFLDWRRYKASLLFGFQQSWSGLLQSLRGALEAAVLPLQLGFAALDLLQCAQSLFLSTVGQVQVVFWIVLPGAIFVGWQGKAVLRVLYGERWIAADPLIAPGAAIGAALCVFGAGYNILLAKTELKRCVVLDITVALATAPVILTVVLGGDMVVYAWALAAGQLVAAFVAIGMATRWL